LPVLGHRFLHDNMFTDSTTLYERARKHRDKAAELRNRAAGAEKESVKEALLQAADSFDVLSRAAIRQAQWVSRARVLLAEVQSYEGVATLNKDAVTRS
jgi:hypothetical protein